MNLLFISNLYPPHHLGGYELLCHEVATLLIARGHTVEVLTSTYGVTPEEPNEPGVHRKLRLQRNVFHYHPKQVLHYFPDRHANLQVVRSMLAETSQTLPSFGACGISRGQSPLKSSASWVPKWRTILPACGLLRLHLTKPTGRVQGELRADELFCAYCKHPLPRR